MNPSFRKLLITAVLVILFFGGFFSWAIYKFSTGVRYFLSREIPEQIKEPRVMTGNGRFARSLFFSKDADSIGETLKKGGNSPDSKSRKRAIDSSAAKVIFGFTDLQIVEGKVVAVGKFGAYVLDRNGALEKSITFSPIGQRISIFGYEFESDQSNHGDLKIARLAPGRIGYWANSSTMGFSVFDENGESIWRTGEERLEMGEFFEDGKETEKRIDQGKYVLESTVGDLDNDGIAEYVVAQKNDGIRAYRQNGDEMWFQPDEFPSATLFVLDADSDGKNELLATGVDSVIRNPDGSIKRKSPKSMSGRENYTMRTDRATGKTFPIFCEIRRSEFDCQDFEGRMIVKGIAPLSEVPAAEVKKLDVPGHPEMSVTIDTEEVAFPKFVVANMESDKPPFYVGVGEFIGIPRACLYVWNQSGDLVYHELLPEDAETIAVLPGDNGRDEVLIGGRDSIWRLAAP